MQPRVFISYRRGDGTHFARSVENWLLQWLDRTCVFRDEERIHVGEQWPERIRREIAQADFFVAVITRDWLSSGSKKTDWVLEETQLALSRAKPMKSGESTQKEIELILLLFDCSPPADDTLESPTWNLVKGFHSRQVDHSRLADELASVFKDRFKGYGVLVSRHVHRYLDELERRLRSEQILRDHPCVDAPSLRVRDAAGNHWPIGAAWEHWIAQYSCANEREARPGSPLLLLAGAAGSGKSVALVQLAMSALTAAREGAPLPVWVRLRDLEGSDVSSDRLCELVRARLDRALPAMRPNERPPDIVLFLDGMDELPAPDFETRRRALCGFLLNHDGPVVLSSRPDDRDANWCRDLGPDVFMIEPLEATERGELVRYLTNRIPGGHARFMSWLSEEGAALGPVSATPFFLVCLVESFFGQDDQWTMSGRPAEILRRVFTGRVRREYERARAESAWLRFSRHGWATADVGAALRLAFGAMADACLSDYEYKIPPQAAARAESCRVAIDGTVYPLPELESPASSLLRLGCLLQVLSRPDANSPYRFTHSLWRDYLAAEYWTEQLQCENDHVLPGATPKPPATDLPRQVLALVAGLLPPESLGPLLVGLGGKDLEAVAECLLENRPIQLQKEDAHRLGEMFLSSCGNPGASAATRRRAAGGLGIVGDPRIWQEGRIGTFPRLIHIPPGRHRVGIHPEDAPGRLTSRALSDLQLEAYEFDSAALHAESAPFLISAFPVTNEQYAEFANNPDYWNPEWWHPGGGPPIAHGRDTARSGDAPILPEFLRDMRFNLPNQPVVGVSPAEACAYCRWLTATRGNRTRFALPTIAQWQAAARGSAGRLYPWGDEQHPDRCNCSGAKAIWSTSPVGSYPDGDTPEGVSDLAGNVMEVCTPDDLPVSSLPPSPRPIEFVACGGSWLQAIRFCRATTMIVVNRERRSNELGFRVVAAAD